MKYEFNKYEFKKSTYEDRTEIVRDSFNSYLYVEGIESYYLRRQLYTLHKQGIATKKKTFFLLLKKSATLFEVEGLRVIVRGKFAYVNVESLLSLKTKIACCNDLIHILSLKYGLQDNNGVNRSVRRYIESRGQKGSKMNQEEFLTIVQEQINKKLLEILELQDEIVMNNFRTYKTLTGQIRGIKKNIPLKREIETIKEEVYELIETEKHLQGQIENRSQIEGFMGGQDEISTFEDYEAFDYSIYEKEVF